MGLVLPRFGAFKRFVSDGAAPLWKKLLIGLVLFYVALPTDFVPDFIPIWGWLDDIGAVALGTLFLSWVLKPYSNVVSKSNEAAPPGEPGE